MSKTAHTAAKPNIYQIVTDRIIHSLKAGVIPWEKPWKTPHFHGGPFPSNFRTGKPYRGVNVLLLWSSPCASPFWLTFKQAMELKGSVRKGEKGTPIVFYKQLQNREDEQKATGEKKERIPFVPCYYTVFNVEQCDAVRPFPYACRRLSPSIGSTGLRCLSLARKLREFLSLQLLARPRASGARLRTISASVSSPMKRKRGFARRSRLAALPSFPPSSSLSTPA